MYDNLEPMLTHDFPFDPRYGYNEDDLRAITPPAVPQGFAEFWQRTYEQALAKPTRPTVRQISSSNPDIEVYELEYDGVDGFRVGGWMTKPVGQEPTRGVVMGHGYGGRDAPDLIIPGPACAAVFPCARGFNRSARENLPANAPEHVTYGIDSPETYIHRYCVSDIFSATSALLELAPQTAGCVDYLGVSFGGGIGAMAIAWERRFRRAFLGVPSFGHHDLRLRMQCAGSGESVRQMHQHNPEIRKTLAMFDSAVSAQFCKVPTMVACALFDPAVPPPGQFAVYNSLAGEKLLCVLQAAHFSWADEQEEGANVLKRQNTWFAR